MNSIAQQALALALGKALSPAESMPRPMPIYSTADPLLDVSDIDTDGPFNQVMFTEGQNFALDMIRSAGQSLTNTAWTRQLVQCLIRAAIGRPPSHAAGVKSIIELLEEVSPCQKSSCPIHLKSAIST